MVERDIISPLTKQGIDVWYSKESIRAGMEWEKSIREGLELCDCFLIAISPRAIESKWVNVKWIGVWKTEMVVLCQSCWNHVILQNFI